MQSCVTRNKLRDLSSMRASSRDLTEILKLDGWVIFSGKEVGLHFRGSLESGLV